MAESRIEKLLNALINGESVDFEPRSRAELYLKNCCDRCGCDGLPAPRSRMEALLYLLAEKLNSDAITEEMIEEALGGIY